jgi:integrase
MSAGNITRRGAHSWRLKFEGGERDPLTGKRQTRFVTVRGTKSQAQAKLRELLTEIDKGSFVEPSKLTIAEHVRARVTQWEAASVISAKTAERYRELVENQIVPHIGDKTLQKLKPADIENWHTALRTNGRKDGKGGVSARTIGHAHRVLSKALRQAARHDLVAKNVAAEEGAPKVDADEVVILTDDQIAELLTKLAGRAIYSRVIVALFTGARRGELLALRWSNTDLETKVIQIREALEETKANGIRFKRAKTKNGRRDITLPDIVVDALREHRRQQLELRMALGLGKLADDALVFPALDLGPQSPRAFSGDWADAAERIGMGDITLHALRHTHASQLIDAGVDVVTISKRLGHASPNITLQIYAHLFRKRDDKAADAINAALATLGKS